MQHPAVTLKFLAIAVVATAVGLFLVSVAVDFPASALRFSRWLGFVLLAVGVINFAVHAVAMLMHGHEMWRRSVTEVTETED
jgi:hypothetical protein